MRVYLHRTSRAPTDRPHIHARGPIRHVAPPCVQTPAAAPRRCRPRPAFSTSSVNVQVSTRARNEPSTRVLTSIGTIHSPVDASALRCTPSPGSYPEIASHAL